MVKRILTSLAAIKMYLSFILALGIIVGFFVLAFVKGVDISSVVPTVFAVYMTARTAEKASAHWAAMKDPEADTASVIRELSDK